MKPQNVRANWPVATLWIVIPAIAIAVILDLVRMLTLHQSGIGGDEVILAGVILAAAVFELGFFFVSVREVRLTAEHAQFIVGFRRVVVPWTDLVPPSSPLRISINFFYRRDGETQDNDGLQVSNAQARALLTYPSSPRFELSDSILKSLGFSSNPKNRAS